MKKLGTAELFAQVLWVLLMPRRMEIVRSNFFSLISFFKIHEKILFQSNYCAIHTSSHSPRDNSQKDHLSLTSKILELV